MKQFLYSMRFILTGKGNNLIKITSLMLGLVTALVLFSQVAFELSYDKFYPEKESLYRIVRKNSGTEGNSSESPVLYSPMPGALMEDLEEVEYGTAMQGTISETDFYYDNTRFTRQLLPADENFFNVLDFTIQKGNPTDLRIASQVFISQSTAEVIFGEKDPIGEFILYKNTTPYRVAGIFKDVPSNCHLKFDMVVSLRTLFDSGRGQFSWLGNDAYHGYLKLAPGVSQKTVEDKIPLVFSKYYDLENQSEKGKIYEYYLQPVKNIHTKQGDTQTIITILSLLGFAMLFVSAMNYVLISISSLVKRARPVGILKSNGATGKHIFNLFMQETIILTVISLFMAFGMIFLFKETIEELMQTSIHDLFSVRSIWVALILTVTVILIAGIIPSRIFSAIPVTHLFQTATTNKRYWKNILLFVQFTSVACMVSTLFITYRQYELMLNKEKGYSDENIAYVVLPYELPVERIFTIKSELSKHPEIVNASLASSLPLEFGIANEIITSPDAENHVQSRIIGADKDYLRTLLIPLAEGIGFNNSEDTSPKVLISEKLALQMNFHGSPIGKSIKLIDEVKEIVGVVPDFQLGNFYNENEPLVIELITSQQKAWYITRQILILKTKKLTPALLEDLNKKIKDFTNRELEFIDYKQVLQNQYLNIRLFRNSIIISSIIILFVTILGLLGYVEDEVFRRSKEIAIRKINGAQVKDILLIVSKDFLYLIVPALIVGSLLSYRITIEWLQQFVVRIPLTLTLYVGSIAGILILLLLCIIARSWQIAHENPVKSIRIE